MFCDAVQLLIHTLDPSAAAVNVKCLILAHLSKLGFSWVVRSVFPASCATFIMCGKNKVHGFSQIKPFYVPLIFGAKELIFSLTPVVLNFG